MNQTHINGTAKDSKLATDLKAAFSSTDGLKDLTATSTAAEIAEAIGKANLTKEEDANKLAQILGEHLTTDSTNTYPKESGTHGTNSYTITEVSDGYYLIIDKAGTQSSSDTNTAYTRIILQVTGNDVAVNPKVLAERMQLSSSTVR